MAKKKAKKAKKKTSSRWANTRAEFNKSYARVRVARKRKTVD